MVKVLSSKTNFLIAARESAAVAYPMTSIKPISIHLEYAKQHSHELGIHVDPRMVPVTGHVSLGKSTGATPNGRIAGFPLSDGASASHGSDTNGPTAVLLSNAASKLFDYRERGSRLINIKFTPSSIAGEDGIEKLISYIRALPCNRYHTWVYMNAQFVRVLFGIFKIYPRNILCDVVYIWVIISVFGCMQHHLANDLFVHYILPVR